jgi:hypothetical protein
MIQWRRIGDVWIVAHLFIEDGTRSYFRDQDVVAIVTSEEAARAVVRLMAL